MSSDNNIVSMGRFVGRATTHDSPAKRRDELAVTRDEQRKWLMRNTRGALLAVGLLMVEMSNRQIFERGDGCECWPSVEFIMERTGLSRRAVYQARAKLVAIGFLLVKNQGGGRTMGGFARTTHFTIEDTLDTLSVNIHGNGNGADPCTLTPSNGARPCTVSGAHPCTQPSDLLPPEKNLPLEPTAPNGALGLQPAPHGAQDDAKKQEGPVDLTGMDEDAIHLMMWGTKKKTWDGAL